MNAYRPTVVPHTIVEFAPTVAPRLRIVVSYNECRLTCERGFDTFVKTHDGPRNTSSSMTTPEYTATLFWILTLFPMSVAPSMLTFCPMTHDLPMRAPFITWAKCQILVPAPI